jgi:ribosomal protein L37AE/L43A
VPEYRPSGEQWTGVDEGINGTVTNCIRNETVIQQQSQPITIPSNRRSRASSLHKPGSRGRPSSADEVHQYLNFIREDGRGSVLNRGGIIQRGTRHGPLTKEQAREIAITRKEQKVCMKCREDRSKCAGGIPCEKCYKLQLRGTLKTPCVKAQFLEIVEAGSCNYISQRAINHLTLDGKRRVQMFLPETFKLGELLSLLETRQNSYRIKARSQFGSLYTLDLRKCYQFLANTCADEMSQEFDLRDFIDNKLLSTSEWFDCVSDFRKDNGIVALLAQWNNMPSRATYSFEPLNGSPSRDMNVEEPQDQVEIVIAAQLSRIICRKAELDGYKALQSAINQTRQKSPLEIQKFAYELGQLLVTLRWRMSWWELLGDGSNKDDIFRDRFVERVRRLSMTLYFYYCSMMRRLPGFSDARAELRGTPSTYADAASFFDDFPVEESIEGFERWMETGKELVRHAGVAQRLSRYQSLQR